MYDGRGSVVEVEQSTGYILQERAFEGKREVRHVFQKVIMTSRGPGRKQRPRNCVMLW